MSITVKLEEPKEDEPKVAVLLEPEDMRNQKIIYAIDRLNESIGMLSEAAGTELGIMNRRLDCIGDILAEILSNQIIRRG